MLPKVSIVVPVYKVERYLNKCIDSILNQSYTNLEIILVNDGSPDTCGEIINKYEKRDLRVKAFHKKNGGLSDARNYGMQFVTGVFSIFVDSDDWLHTSFIHKLVETSLKYKADIVQSAFYYAFEDYLLYDDRYYAMNTPAIKLDNKTLMTELVINKKVKNFAWGKLYKTELIRDIPFEKNVLFEDVFWAHKVMSRVNSYIILSEPLYYYYQRHDSIVASYTAKNLDIIKGLKERHLFIQEYYKELTFESYKTILETSLNHYYLLVINRMIDINGNLRGEIQSYINENYYDMKKAVNNNKILKIQLSLFMLNPYAYILFILGEKVFRKVRILPKPKGLKREEVN